MAELKLTATSAFDWGQYHAYTAFDEFLRCFVIQRRSLIIRHEGEINVEEALAGVKRRYIENFDEGKQSFNQKAETQFDGASKNTRLFFAHVEYLWAMPMSGMGPVTKKNYARRLLPEEEVVDDEGLYFEHPHPE